MRTPRHNNNTEYRCRYLEYGGGGGGGAVGRGPVPFCKQEKTSVYNTRPYIVDMA